jgi:serine/threonine-protein kinase
MTAFTLDDLKTAWQALDRKLERQHALVLHQFKETKLAKLRGGFRPLVAGQIIQTIMGLLLALFGGSFWFDHIGKPHLVIYGLSLHAFGVMYMVFGIRDLALIHGIDYDAPVLAIQKQLAELRSWHLRAAISFGVAGCLIWVPSLLVIFYLLGADVWIRNPEVVLWNVVSSVLCLALGYGVLWWSRRPGRERLAKYLQDSSVGKSVTRAQEMLGEIERFERDGDSAA